MLPRRAITSPWRAPATAPRSSARTSSSAASRPTTSGPPTLDADGLGSVVTLLGVVVTIEDLTIEGGRFHRQTAERWRADEQLGTLTLRDVIVRGNQARRAAASATRARSRWRRQSHQRRRQHGVGIYNRGTLTMNGASSISEHEFWASSSDGGTLTMNDHSSIRDNRSGVIAGRQPTARS